MSCHGDKLLRKQEKWGTGVENDRKTTIFIREHISLIAVIGIRIQGAPRTHGHGKTFECLYECMVVCIVGYSNTASISHQKIREEVP